MSVNRNVTVPTGFSLVEAGASTSVMLLLRHGPEARGEAREARERERRRLQHGLLEVPAGEGEAAGGLDRDHLGDTRLAVEHRQLAEEVAGAKRRDGLAAPKDATGP